MSNHLYQLIDGYGTCRATIVISPDPHMMVILHDGDIEKTKAYRDWSDSLRRQLLVEFPDGWQESEFINNTSPDDPEV